MSLRKSLRRARDVTDCDCYQISFFLSAHETNVIKQVGIAFHVRLHQML